MIYTCNRCNNYKTKDKSNYNRHLKRKKPCVKTTKTTKKTTKSNDLGPEKTQNDANLTPKNTKNTLNDANLTPKNTKNTTRPHNSTCVYCNKVFSRIDSLNRHIKSRCKIKHKRDENEQLQYENQRLQTIINQNAMNTRIEQVVINNSINLHTVNNHITINAYGKEDLSHLIPHVIIEVIRMKTLDESIETWTMLKYNDKKNHPENCTVRMPKDHSKYAEISAGDGKWNTTTKKQLVIEITNNAYSQLKTFIMNNPHRFGVSFYDKFQRFFEVSKELKNTVECALISKALPRNEDIDIPDIMKYANYNVKHT